MKILLLSDIHSNWAALSAIKESFDVCLFAGDAVDYGANPVPCVHWLQENANVAIRGNHDHAVAQHVPARRGTGFRELAAATRPLHWELLSNRHIKYLTRMPVTKRVVLDDLSFYLVHATPRDPMDEYLADNADAWEMQLESIEADFVCVGHTHLPFHLHLGKTQVINSGSVGQPRDGDPRCSYVMIEDGKVHLRRVSYNVDAAIDQLHKAGVTGEAMELAERVLRTGSQMVQEEKQVENKNKGDVNE